MKILVIDNNTKHLDALKHSLNGHELTIQKYKPGINFKLMGQELVILSGGGGEGKEANDETKNGKLWYQDEISFIKRTKLPIIGICMGFELIAQAYGAKIEKLPKLIQGWQNIKTGQRTIRQFESHNFCVKKIPQAKFKVLASSEIGIEMFRHKSRPIIATQFHPEIHGSTLSLDRLIMTPHLLKN